jgi:hypothetical protein
MKITLFGIVNFSPFRPIEALGIVSSNFEISGPQCSTKYSGDVLDAVVHQKLRLSDVVTHILDSEYLPIMFSILDPFNKGKALFQSLASEIVSPNIQIHFSNEADRPPLWSSGQSSWLQIRRPGFDSRYYQKKKWVWNGVHSAS